MAGTAFVGGIPVRSNGGQLAVALSTSSREPRVARRVQLTMAAGEGNRGKGQQMRRGGPGKKTKHRKPEGPYNVAVDMKGNPIWNMRAATVADAKAFVNNSKLSEDLVVSMIESSDGCSLVAELQEKGSSDGTKPEVFDPMARSVVDKQSSTSQSRSLKPPKVVGGVLVLFQKSIVVSNSGDPMVVSEAEIAAAFIDPRVPEMDMTFKRLGLGCLKQMKTTGVSSVAKTVTRGSANESFYKSIGLVEDKADSTEQKVKLVADLLNISPDPQKKIT